MRKKPRRIWVDPRNPQVWGTSDMNGFIGPRSRMSYQEQWAGDKIVALGSLVHPDELDIPNRQLGNVVLTADPPPKRNSRPEDYTFEEASYLSTEDGDAIVVENTGTSILDAPITAEPGQ